MEKEYLKQTKILYIITCSCKRKKNSRFSIIVMLININGTEKVCRFLIISQLLSE